MSKKLDTPKGATHVQLTTPEGKNSIVELKDAETSFAGVPGKITFLLHNKKEKGAKAYTPFHGEIDNPFATPAKAAPAKAAPAEPQTPESVKSVDAPATEAVTAPAPAAATKKKTGKKASATPAAPAKEKDAKDVKFPYIVSLMDGTLTANAIALKLMHKFPNPKLQKGKMKTRTEILSPWSAPKGGEEKTIYCAEFAKAIAYVRSSRYHMKKRGIKGHYAKATGADPKPSKTTSAVTPKKKKRKKAVNAIEAVVAQTEAVSAAAEKQVQVANINSGEVETIPAPPTVTAVEPAAVIEAPKEAA